VASYGIEGRDTACEFARRTYSCDWHAATYWQAAREGWWCSWSGHRGHAMTDLVLGRLV
jgi:hypothetical protein